MGRGGEGGVGRGGETGVGRGGGERSGRRGGEWERERGERRQTLKLPCTHIKSSPTQGTETIHFSIDKLIKQRCMYMSLTLKLVSSVTNRGCESVTEQNLQN